MTEAERQQKIASALAMMSALCRSWVDMADHFSKAAVQLEHLAKEFDAGRYLPKETDAIGPESTPPPPGEGDAP